MTTGKITFRRPKLNFTENQVSRAEFEALKAETAWVKELVLRAVTLPLKDSDA